MGGVTLDKLGGVWILHGNGGNGIGNEVAGAVWLVLEWEWDFEHRLFGLHQNGNQNSFLKILSFFL